MLPPIVPEADESDRLIALRSFDPVMSSSVSSRLAAARIGSTWSGRRKPTIAPSTAGLRSVQATATAPGTVSWRSATAPQALDELEVARELAAR